jgi:Spy/CpxP family protein refolding chaperone
MKHSFKSKWPKALGIILTVGGLSLLSGCHKSPEERITKISEKIADKLDFTDQQKVLLGDITTELKKDFAEEKAYKQSMQGDFKAMLLAPDLDKAKIKEAIKARQARMDSKVDKYLDKVAALHKTLSSEQKAEIIEKLEKFQNHWD